MRGGQSTTCKIQSNFGSGHIKIAPALTNLKADFNHQNPTFLGVESSLKIWSAAVLCRLLSTKERQRTAALHWLTFGHDHKNKVASGSRLTNVAGWAGKAVASRDDKKLSFRLAKNGGLRGIRTLDRLSPIHTFQACAFNRSATSPLEGRGYKHDIGMRKGGCAGDAIKATSRRAFPATHRSGPKTARADVATRAASRVWHRGPCAIPHETIGRQCAHERYYQQSSQPRH
jgi:hypothetical protein